MVVAIEIKIGRSRALQAPQRSVSDNLLSSYLPPPSFIVKNIFLASITLLRTV